MFACDEIFTICVFRLGISVSEERFEGGFVDDEDVFRIGFRVQEGEELAEDGVGGVVENEEGVFVA